MGRGGACARADRPILRPTARQDGSHLTCLPDARHNGAGNEDGGPPGAAGHVGMGRRQMKKVMAVASGGGHWQQMMALRPAFAGCAAFYVTTIAGLPEQFDAHPSRIVRDCNRNEPVATLICTLGLLRVVLVQRPDVVVSTGALPGVIALALGRLVGARTVWIDSIANSEEMSMSGRLARRVAHLWMSQWPHVAAESGAEYAGSVL